jgi:hypothetical protein
MPPLYRRNFLPAVILTIFLWIACGLMIVFIDPGYQFSLFSSHLILPVNILLLMFVLTLALTLTFALLLANTRRGLLLSLFIIGGLLLRLGKILNWFTLITLFVFLLIVELFFARKKRR